MLKPTNLRCEYLYNPLGIDVVRPRLSWVLDSDKRAQKQSAYQILVAPSLDDLKANRGTLWDSGRVDSNQSTHVVYVGQELWSGMHCWWKVRVWDQDGQPSPYSAPAWWQMGLLMATDWRALWISLDTGPPIEVGMKPCAYLRRSFQIDQAIRRATLYATAKGLYELHLNGHRVGDAVLCPGWTDYNKRIQYQTYDVTQLLQVGDNAMGAILGDGWYHGRVGHLGRSHYGPYPQFLAQLGIEYADGGSATLITDETWKGSSGPILFSDLLMRESYDARKEIPDWDQIAYVFPDGRIEGGTQTAYVLALHFDLFPSSLRKAAAGYLVEEIEERDWHLSTGFLGTTYLCPVLTENGYANVAYRLLSNETCPLWGYMIKHGATTIWERWNSWTEDNEPHEPGMNSYNHYALGAAGDWLYRFVGGIDTDPAQPGFQKILIRPRPGGALTYAKTSYQSVHGRIASDWRIQENALYLDVTIPANTTATVYVPATHSTIVTESGRSTERAQGVQFIGREDGAMVFAVGSGEYHFVAVDEAAESDG